MANGKAIRNHSTFGRLFAQGVPLEVKGFAPERHDQEVMEKCWPAGEEVAKEVSQICADATVNSNQMLHASQILERFLHTRARKTAARGC